MKVLFIDHVEADCLAALVYLGLCQELGAENVVDWPWKDSYHGYTYEGPVPYDEPNNWGPVAPFTWFPAQDPSYRTNVAKVSTIIGSFDVVVLASPRRYSMKALDYLLICVKGRQSIPRLVVMDGEDYSAIRWDVIERYKPSVYFKLTMTEPVDVARAASNKVRLVPLQLATPIVDLAPVVKDIDVAFFGGNNWRPRRSDPVYGTGHYKKELERRLAKEFPNFIGGYMHWPQYVATLNRAKIAVSVGGSGLEPLRTFEILGCQGTMLARERIQIVGPHPLVDGVHQAAFDGTNHDDIVRVIRHYLDHEEERQRIAAAGYALVQEHYTPRARARQLLAEALA
jgi:Glycosyl transferases group 1